MRWFKHLSSAHDNEKLAALLAEFGAEGYGVFWIILEKIAALMPTSKEDFLKEPGRCSASYSVGDWANFCRISVKKFQKILEFLKISGIFLVEFSEKTKKFLKISCPKLLIYRDEHTKRLGSDSGVTRE